MSEQQQSSVTEAVPRKTTERLQPSEAAYLAHVRDGAARAEQLRAHADADLLEAVALEGARESYILYLADRYDLDHANDHIDGDVILRASARS